MTGDDRNSDETSADPSPLAVLVSACLLGHAVRYDGGERRCAHAVLQHWLAEGRVIAICPEVAGGLAVPRPAAEIADGASGDDVLAGSARVVDRAGDDHSAAYVAGAQQILALARTRRIGVAVLKELSPSCGSGRIHDGTFSGATRAGSGVTSALLRQAGIAVFNEDQFDAAAERLGRLARD